MSIRKGENILSGMGVVETGIYQKDVIDSADSTSTTLPPSANQVRILNEKINDLEENSSSTNHVHDDRYYTETEIDEKFEDAKVTKDAVTSVLGYTPLTETEIDNKVSDVVSTHNTATNSHVDIRNLITELTTRLNALADSDDTTLDQMSEIVTYIKSNKSLIESITTSKVSVSDIVDNLTTNVSDKVLSASQGVVLKGLIDTLENELNSHTENNIQHITSTERTNWNDANSKKHEHSNKSVLDTITSALINSWNNAVSHISDTVKHITNEERSLWNTVSDKADTTTLQNKIDAVKKEIPTIDAALSDSSTNPLQNKVVKTAIDNHVNDKNNPHGVTASQIEALKIYTSLSELGLDELTATAQNIVEAMDNNSILLHGCSSEATSATLAFPFNYGLLQVIKRNNSYTDFEYNMTNRKYYAYYNGGSSVAKWSGWSTHFLPLTGGVLTGSVAVQKTVIPEFILKAAKSMSKISKNASETVEGGLLIYDYADTTDTTNNVNLGLSHIVAKQDIRQGLKFRTTVDGTVTSYSIFGEHNKPSGTYTGTGVARTINTGGIGNMVVIYSSKGSALVTPYGGMYAPNAQESTVLSLSSGMIRCNNGVITVGSESPAHNMYNASGVTYTYQVL